MTMAAMATSIDSHIPWEPAEPLWKRVPARDETGRALSDFMMLFPGLRNKPARELQAVLNTINGVLRSYDHAVVFADMNLRLNLLWVSVRPIPGICLELPAAIHYLLPEAKLIAHKPDM